VDFDIAWYLNVNDFARHTAWLHGIAAAYASWAGLVALAALSVIAWWKARREAGPSDRMAIIFLTGTATVISVLCNQALISPLFARPRPCLSLADVEVLVKCATDYSMPSDHCIIAGAFMAGRWLTGYADGAAATVLATMLAFTRVYVGVHYPLDTIVGLCAGALICTVIVFGLRQHATSLVNKLTATRLRPMITSAPLADLPARCLPAPPGH